MVLGRPRVSESAKKRRKKEANQKQTSSRIQLGKEAARWKSVRHRTGLSNVKFIRHLLDIHEAQCVCEKQRDSATPPATSPSSDFSTPGNIQVTTPPATSPSSDFSTPGNIQVATPPATSPSSDFSTPGNIQVSTPGKVDTQNFDVSFSSLAASLASTPPFSQTSPTQCARQLDLEQMEEEVADEGETESVYDPNLSDTRATFGEGSDRSAMEEDIDDDEDLNMPDQMESLQDVVSAEKFVAYLDPLMDLVKKTAGSSCSRRSCDQPLVFSHRSLGTAVVIKWKCSAGHECGSWSSQPRVKNMFAGNLQLSSSILFSGNSFQKVALLFKFMDLGCITEATFYQVQKLYAAPAVDRYWADMQTRLLLEKSRQGKPVCLAGDGRNDSPGYSAMYCTYGFMDLETNAVLHLEVVDVRQAPSSVGMEKVGFIKGLKFLLSHVEVAEIVTDQNKSIIKVLATDPAFKGIIHQFDIWHAGKNLEKRLIAVCLPQSQIKPWIRPIKNHFWWCSQMCEGNTKKMKETWVRVLSHVVNEHEWTVVGHTAGECSHGPLNQEDHEVQWLEKKSQEMDTLRQVVADRNFLKQFPHFRNFRHTGMLEGFNSHILMYAPKRHSYHLIGYQTRNKIAAIDHNHHLNRPEKVDSNGETVYCGNYSRRSQRWRPKVVKQDKNYSYILDLQLLTFELRANEEKGKGGLKRKRPVDPDDPTLIASTIAKRPCPPLRDLVNETISRFSK